MRGIWAIFSIVIVLSLLTPSLAADTKSPFLFNGKNDASGNQLWQTDNTPQGTKPVTLNPQITGDSKPYLIGSAGSIGIFSAFSPANKEELWRTDGTTQGTLAFKNLVPNIPTTLPKDNLGWSFTKLGQKIFIWARESNFLNLTVTDGTSSGTHLLHRFPYNEKQLMNVVNPEVYAFKQHIYFVIDDGIQGEKLWHSDGSITGTKPFANYPQEFSGIHEKRNSWNDLTNEKTWYFISPKFYDRRNKGDPRLLWRISQDKAEVLQEFTSNQRFSLLAEHDNILLLQQMDENFQYIELWQFDINTKQLKKISQIPTPQGKPPSISPVLFFQGRFYLWLTFDRENIDIEVWRTDLTAQGTQRLVSLPFTYDEFRVDHEAFIFADHLYFFIKYSLLPAELWTTDGTPQGTRRLLKQDRNHGEGDNGGWFDYKSHVLVGDKLIFPTYSAVATDRWNAFEQLWSLSATEPEKPQLLGEFYSPRILPPPKNTKPTTLQFISDHQRWETDGTKAGTKLIGSDPLNAYEFMPLTLPNEPTWLAIHKDARTDKEVWLVTTDPKRSQLLKDINTSATEGKLTTVLKVGDDWYYNWDYKYLWFAEKGVVKAKLVEGLFEVSADSWIVSQNKQGTPVVYFLIRDTNTETATIWQLIKGKATQLMKVNDSARLYPSQKGFYFLKTTKPTGFTLQHWQDEQITTVLENNAKNERLQNFLETPDGLIYVISASKPKKNNTDSEHDYRLLWKPNASSESQIINTELSFDFFEYWPRNLFKTRRQLYILQRDEKPSKTNTFPPIYTNTVSRIDVEQKRLIPVKTQKPLQAIKATSEGLFLLTGSKQMKLWYLADNTDKPKLLKTFAPHKEIELVDTFEQTLYFNIKPSPPVLSNNIELWMSDGTTANTRLLKKGIEMNSSRY